MSLKTSPIGLSNNWPSADGRWFVKPIHRHRRRWPMVKNGRLIGRSIGLADASVDPGLLQRTDITASFAGLEVIIISYCRQVRPTQIFWSGKVNSTCYAYVPVVIAGKLMFIVPGGNDLVSEAPIISCFHRTPNIYFNGKEWVTSKGPIHVESVSPKIVWKVKWKPVLFNAPSVFHDDLSG